MNFLNRGRSMFSRFGLRSRMGVSYVLVSAAAVVVVETVLLAVMVPQMQSASDRAEQAQQRLVEAEHNTVRTKVEKFALEIAAAAGAAASAATARKPGRTDEELLVDAADTSLQERPDQPRSDGSGGPPGWAQVLATVDGRVIAGSPAGQSTLPTAAVSSSARSGQTEVNGQPAYWATNLIEITDGAGTGRRVIGIAYALLVAEVGGAKKPPAADAGVGALVLPGVIILVLLLPVGGLFGLLSTGRLIRRIHRLADGTSAMASGDLTNRIPVSGGDEVGRLEQAFNSMAERLDAAVQAQRKAAGWQARRAERTRIARELHDSISQDLFSASLLAGGLRKALPTNSELRRQAESMELTMARTMREMRAMLLELRPIDLEDAGLAEALDQLSRAYQTRLGVSISTRVDSLRLDATVEHAVLRVVQEAFGNAVRHGEPDTIELQVIETGGQVAVTVHDDGKGFDPQQVVGRHGMGLAMMRERIDELGGSFEVVSAPQRGTTVTVLVPAGGR